MSCTDLRTSSSRSQPADRLRWGVIGAGRIATVFCNALRFSKTGALHAVASQSLSRARRLSELFGAPRAHRGYESLLSDPEVDAVYIANLNSDHARWAVEAARAGKHVLVEKPIALTTRELSAMTNAARSSGVTLMEGFMYRFHPQVTQIRDLISAGAIGEVRHMEATFGYRASGLPDDRVYQRAQGGGALWDVGCYTTSAALWVARCALGPERRDQVSTRGDGQIGSSGVDLHAVATLSFSDQLFANLATSLVVDLPSRWVIYGDEGRLDVLEPWLPSTLCRSATAPLPLEVDFPSSTLVLSQSRGGRLVEERLSVEVDRDLFSYEIDAFAEAISHGEHEYMPWSESFENIELLTRWRAEVTERE